MSKYDPLHRFLDDAPEPIVRMRFVEIERLLGEALPASARRYSAWWSNESPGGRHVQSRAWLDAGYRTRNVDLNAQSVEFVSVG